jgi:hypothetical protein
MIEIELSAITRQCLQRRIPTIEQLEKEVLALIRKRSDKQIKIDWQFSIEAARDKMFTQNSRPRSINPNQVKFATLLVAGSFPRYFLG